MRIDRFLVENKYFSSREKAIVAIKDKRVLVNKNIVLKASFDVKELDLIEVISNELEYVSRGGKKLEHAIRYFNLDFKDKIVLDIGSSTGGFTDCSLKFGAKKVYAIDVGTNQMDENLAKNKQVILKENFNLKNLKIDTFNTNFGIIVTDVSFISLKHVFKVINDISNDNTLFVALIKPQFESENQFLNKNGVIKDKNAHIKIIEKVVNYANQYNFYINKLTYSPIKGKKEGNIEFLGLFSRISTSCNINIEEVVDIAHNELM